MKNAQAPYHFDQIHRKEPKSYWKLKAMATNVLEGQQQTSFYSSESNSACEGQSSPSRTSE